MTAGPASPHPRHGLDSRAAEDRRSILGRGVCLTLARDEGRWSHALSVGTASDPAADPGGTEAIARSLEATPGPDATGRVLSPTYQEIHEQAMADGVQLLMTGQATPHHFSAVLTPSLEAAADGGRGAIVFAFDVADRCRAPVTVLAATYLIALGSGALRDAGPNRILWGGEAVGEGSLEFLADAATTLALSEAGRRACRVQALAKIDPASRTHRLAYRWRWTPP